MITILLNTVFPKTYVDAGVITREVTLMFWGAAIGIMTALGVFMRKKNESSPGIYGAAGIMLLLASVSEMLQISSFYWMEEGLVSSYIACVGIGIEYVGFSFLVKHIETKLGNPAHYIFTIMSLTVAAVFFVGIDLRKVELVPSYVFIPIAIIMLTAGLSVPAMYAYIAKRTSADIRKRSILAGVGFFILLSGLLIQESTVHYMAPWGIEWYESTFHLPYAPLPPGAVVVGLVIIAYALHTIQIK